MVKDTVKLENILFIPFFEALKTNDYKSLGVTEDQLDDLSNEYFNLIEAKENPIEKQLQRIYIDASIIKSCIVILIEKGYDKDMIEIVKDYGFELYPDNVKDVIEKLTEKSKGLDLKYKVLKSQLPNNKEAKKSSAYDILAQLSLGLEMKLEFKKVTVLEYISLSSALKEKNIALRKIYSKNK